VNGLGVLVVVAAFIIGCYAVKWGIGELLGFFEQLEFESGSDELSRENEGHDGYYWS